MKTYGSTVVVPTRGRGGLYYDINPLDLEIAQFRGLELWLDGKSLASRSPMKTASRTDGGPINAPTASASPAIFGSTGSFDGPGYIFDRTAAQRLEAPEYVIGQSYTMIAVVSFADGAGGVNGIFGHLDAAGNRVRCWVSQSAAGDPFGLNINHASSGAQNAAAAGSTGIVSDTRYIIWAVYDAPAQRSTLGRGDTVLNNNSITTLPKTQAGIGIGSTGAITQTMSGRLDAFFSLSIPLYNPFGEHAANRLRADLIAAISERYDVAA